MADISPIRVYVGDDGLVQFALVDTTGTPINLEGATAGADFWPAFMANPVDLTAAGGGVTVLQIKPALVLLTVPRSITSGIEQNSALQKIFPTRARIWVIDTLGHRQTVQLVPFQPLRPRDTDLPSAVAVMTTITAVLSPQGLSGLPGPEGPPGPAPTDAQVLAAVAAYIAANPITPVDQPIPITSGVLDFSDPANGGLLAALGIFGTSFVPSTSSALDFSSPANSGLVAVFGV